jgi:hypothetical protein
MLDLKKVDRIVTAAARKALGKEFVRAESELTADSRGEDALRVLLVIESGAADRITGATAVDTLVGVQDALEKAGEERLPIIEYATEQELAEVDEP